jgi:hypothetical protein
MIGLWGSIKEIYDARNKEREKQDKQGASGVSMPSGTSSMLSQARSMSSGNFHMPSMPHL